MYVLKHKALTTPLMSSATVSCIQIYLDFSSVECSISSQFTEPEQAQKRERGKKRTETDGGVRPTLTTSHRDSLLGNIMNPY